MAYEIKDASYGEYKKFCAAEGLVPVPYEEYGFEFWLAFCQQHRIPNAVNDENGMPRAPKYEPQATRRTACLKC